ncbi:delta(14)-sterol reductase LBR isoform X7 [Phyllopteryx taeniolatus]|uniref:delta(14)-sterol reductase LBR isoform X7 n=1 Tax=Phyllopteryx taeniolatus TaxID=161469 RepID=UPI002AD57BD5|nr:delta(14)-sterol reductase LBR isoform X7 [Phyllopteryx taeniolatus]
MDGYSTRTMPSVKYHRGDTVMGRWPGSNLYYEVKVLGFEAKSQLYTVIYKDGTELELKEQDIRVGPELTNSSGFQPRSRSRSRSPGRRRSRSRSPARNTRRSSSRAAAAVAAAAITESAPLSRRDSKLKEMVEVRLSPLQQPTLAAENNSNNKHENKDENNTAKKVNESEAKMEPEPEKNQNRYNLRRRKDDGEAKPQNLEITKVVTAPAVMVSNQLDFGGKIGFFAIVTSAAVVAAAVYQGVDVTYVHSHFLQLAVATFFLSVLLSVYLYIRSRYAPPDQQALGGSSGNVIYDFFKGHELNPRIQNFDLKFFCEMRPGLIGWCLINFAFALAEMKQQGLDTPSYAMILVNVCQLIYVVDGLWNEEAILTTMDLMHDGFGFMLAFGDLVWVPFTYTLQAYYLVSHPNPLSLSAVAAIVLLKLIGFYIFRKSNSEKNAFRRNPSDPKLSYLKTIPTATGKSLLVSGWWGVVRHPNYLGDLIMALAWSIPCGFGHLLPWYYMIYFIILLVHRDSRDMSDCRRKYGSAWDEYCRTVRYRIVPRVY